MPSLSYHITLFILKLKGIKGLFSQDPIPYKTIRKDDVKTPHSSKNKELTINSFKVKSAIVHEIIPTDAQSSSLVIYCHGGAFISGPTQLHWDSVYYLAQKSQTSFWLVDYPKAPEHKIEEICSSIDAVYEKALEIYPSHSKLLMGDSVGGNLILTLTQRLISYKRPLPTCIIAITPVLDASMSNPECLLIEPNDPILGINGVRSAKMMCAGEKDLKDPMISPLYGDFTNFPKTYFMLGTRDIMTPDALLAQHKSPSIEVLLEPEMPHIGPLLPFMKEAKAYLNQLVSLIEKAS